MSSKNMRTFDRPTISQIIAELQDILRKNGDLPIVTLDETTGYPSTFMMTVEDAGEYNENGYYEFAESTDKKEKVCVVGYIP